LKRNGNRMEEKGDCVMKCKLWIAVATACVMAATFTIGSSAWAQEVEEVVRLTDEDCEVIFSQAFEAANKTKSLLRVDSEGNPQTTKMHVFIVNREGEILAKMKGMEDVWTGSKNIAWNKARTAAMFSSNENALTSRSIGELSQPGGPLWNIGNSNVLGNGQALIQFPGGIPLYKQDAEDNYILVGAIGVSGDGVDQDEKVTIAGAVGFEPHEAIPIDKVTDSAYSYTKQVE